MTQRPVLPRRGVPGLDVHDEACVFIAWEAGELSEGEVARLLGEERIDLRDRRLRMLDRAKRLRARIPESALVKEAKRRLAAAKDAKA